MPALVAVALVLTACGGSGRSSATSTSVQLGPTASSPTPPTGDPSPGTETSTPGSASPTPVHVDPAAQRIFARSKAATARLASLRIVDTVVKGGTTQRLDLRFGRHGTAGRITRGGYTFDILFVGTMFYFHAPTSFLKAQYKTTIPPAVRKSEGKYVASSMTSSNAQPYRSLANRTAVLAGVYYAHPNLRRGPNKRIGGVLCIGLVDPGKGTFYVRADNALPVELDSTVSDGSKLAFSDFNRVPEPQAPAPGQAVDSEGNPV